MPDKESNQVRKYSKLDIERKTDLLEAVIECGGNVKKACEELGIVSRTVYYALERDEDFAKEMALSIKAGDRLIIDEIRRRSIDGVIKEIYYKGDVVGTEKQYSDRLLECLARARHKEFRPASTVEHTGSVAQQVIVCLPDNGRTVELEQAEVIDV